MFCGVSVTELPEEETVSACFSDDIDGDDGVIEDDVEPDEEVDDFEGEEDEDEDDDDDDDDE
jgi:hypothetical protein